MLTTPMWKKRMPSIGPPFSSSSSAQALGPCNSKRKVLRGLGLDTERSSRSTLTR